MKQIIIYYCPTLRYTEEIEVQLATARNETNSYKNDREKSNDVFNV